MKKVKRDERMQRNEDERRGMQKNEVKRRRMKKNKRIMKRR